MNLDELCQIEPIKSAELLDQTIADLSIDDQQAVAEGIGRLTEFQLWLAVASLNRRGAVISPELAIAALSRLPYDGVGVDIAIWLADRSSPMTQNLIDALVRVAIDSPARAGWGTIPAVLIQYLARRIARDANPSPIPS